MRQVYIYFFILLHFALIKFSCSDEHSSNKSKIFNSLLDSLNSIYGNFIEKNVDIYYLESSVCLPCQEKFWWFYMNQDKINVLIQVENPRIKIRKIIPGYIKDISKIIPVNSNSISKLIDKLGREYTGVYLIKIREGTVSDVSLFMK